MITSHTLMKIPSLRSLLHLKPLTKCNISSFSLRHQPIPALLTMKLDTPQFRAILTPEVMRLVGYFQKHGHQIRVAGGAVRDLLMDKVPEDIDFATTATPQQMKEMFTTEGVRMLHKKGEAHGTVTCRIDDKQNFEVTTLRVDMLTDGRHAEVEFTTDWLRDAARRDLTINAMFLGFDGTLYDYYNGKDDLEKRCIRFVGDPACRIKEDYLRILRYFRFYGRISTQSDDHCNHTLEAIKNNSEGLGKISGERLWLELKKILVGNFVKEIVLKMIEVGVGPHIGFPNRPNLAEFADVCDKSHGMKPHSVTKLVGLFHDENEVLSLHGRLKFSKYERDLALFVVNNRRVAGLRPLLSSIVETKGKTSDTQEWCLEVLKYQGNVTLFRELNDFRLPKFPITGHILMELGFKPGPKMNELITELRTLWLNSDFQMTKTELLEHVVRQDAGDL